MNMSITVEDGCVHGGFGSAVIEFMVDNGYKADVVRLGMPDKVIEHGSQEQLYAECPIRCGLYRSRSTSNDIRKKVPKVFGNCWITGHLFLFLHVFSRTDSSYSMRLLFTCTTSGVWTQLRVHK